MKKQIVLALGLSLLASPAFVQRAKELETLPLTPEPEPEAPWRKYPMEDNPKPERGPIKNRKERRKAKKQERQNKKKGRA